jgi:hypothetical protein
MDQVEDICNRASREVNSSLVMKTSTVEPLSLSSQELQRNLSYEKIAAQLSKCPWNLESYISAF